MSLVTAKLVQASPTINVDSNNRVIGVSGLEISRRVGKDTFTNVYNINFRFNSFNSLFGNPSNPNFTPSCGEGITVGLCFWQNPTPVDPGSPGQESQAAREINSALNLLDLRPSTIIDPIAPPFVNPIRNNYAIPSGFDGTSIQFVESQFNNTAPEADTYLSWFLAGENQVILPNNPRMYAQVELVETRLEIPESSNVISLIMIGVFLVSQVIGPTNSQH